MTNQTITTPIKGLLLGALAAATALHPLRTAADSTQGLGDMIFTAGTVATDSHGREWAYLSWMATDPSMLMGVQYDIYAKDGDIASGNPYVFKGSAMLQADPNSITILANRAVNLGQDLSKLENAIDQLFAEAIPSGSLSLGEKIAAVINGSMEDSEMFQNLIFMSQAHPALSLAIGRGYACMINGTGLTTFEIRDHNSAEVIGRLTVEGGNPLVLPAPANIIQITDDSPKGNLNIRLRWMAPEALRRVSLMQFGYNIYRMEKDFAEGKGYDGTPPSIEALKELVDGNYAKRVNNLPILADEDNVKPDTYFFIDDNEGLTDGIPFTDGEEFYYYVTALDLLGRDGLVSDGFLAIACDRLAPRVPKDIRTRALYDYSGGTAVQSVEISWDQDPDFAETAGYYVYRHSSFSNMQANADNPAVNLIAGPIAPISGAERLAYTNTLTLADQDRTYWYTLRGIDNAACGPNLSLNSAPVHGGIHDWEGPENPVNATVDIFKETVTASHKASGYAPIGGGYNMELRCGRNMESVKWVEFAYLNGEYGLNRATNAISLGRHYFNGQNMVTKRLFLSRGKGTQYTFYCRVGTDLKTSGYTFVVRQLEADAWSEFEGNAAYNYGPGPAGGPHVLHPPNLNWPRLIVDVPAGAGEYRFYRRVDNGPRTLIAQGPTTNATQIIEEDRQAGIVNGGTICYYHQFLDFNGNPGPMTQIECIDVARTIDLPIPDLYPIKSTGTETASPGMEAKWFCPPQGVERFEVALHMNGGGYPATFDSELRGIEDNGVTNFFDAVINGETNNLGFVTYRTGRVGANFGVSDEADFQIEPSVDLNVEYVLMVRALGPNGEKGAWSSARTFEWKAVPEQGPQVPWPARGLPPVQTYAFHTNLYAKLLYPETEQGIDVPRIGIRIGEIPGPDVGDISKDSILLTVNTDPMDYLYRDAQKSGETVMPCVLYRYQVISALYPEVSGDVAQVSVMMESMAWGDSTPSRTTAIYDPFVAAVRQRGNEADPWGLYLLDTHPVVNGAAYRYLLMRFGTDGEPDRIIDAGTVTIPE